MGQHSCHVTFKDKLSKYFHTSQQNMADKAATTPTTTPTTDGGSNNNVMTSPTTTTTSASSASSASSSSSSSSNKLNKRKLSFMNPFTSRQNSESSLQSPSNETTASTTTHNSGTDSPRHRKSISAHTEHHGSAASSTSETSSTIDGEGAATINEFTANVTYLEKVELRNPGLPEIMETVGNVYTRAKPSLKSMGRSILTLNTDGIHIKPDIHHHGGSSSTKSLNNVYNMTDTLKQDLTAETDCLFKARRILYCGVDKTHPKVFFFNYQYGLRAENIQLNMVICKTTKDSKELAKRLSQLFKRIQIEQHKRDKEKREDHIQNVQRVRTRSNQNITSSSTNGSKEGSCSGTYGSGGSASEWAPGLQLSMAS